MRKLHLRKNPPTSRQSCATPSRNVNSPRTGLHTHRLSRLVGSERKMATTREKATYYLRYRDAAAVGTDVESLVATPRTAVALPCACPAAGKIIMAEVHYVYDTSSGSDIGPHVFPTEKYALLARYLRDELGVGDERFHGWEAVTDEDVGRVHTPNYVEDMRLARASSATLSSELPVEHEVIDAFWAMAGGSIAAVRLALEHGVGFHIGGGFHHAFPDHAEGFCYLHDMAIAVERFRVGSGLNKVLFVDVDLHQGNGTAVIYRGDEDTYTYTIHQEHNYPVKQKSDLDRGLHDWVCDEEYIEALQADLDTIDRCFQPQLVCYVAGVDPFHADQLGGLALSEEGLRKRDRLVLERFIDRDVPVAVFLAGGYAPTPEQTARLHLGTAAAAEKACVAGDG